MARPEANKVEMDGYVVLTGTVEPEGNQFVSCCRELGTSSCGDTVHEALESLGDAIQVHLDALEETGELHSFLREKNVNIYLSPPPDEISVRVPPGKMFTTYKRQIPAVPASASV